MNQDKRILIALGVLFIAWPIVSIVSSGGVREQIAYLISSESVATSEPTCSNCSPTIVVPQPTESDVPNTSVADTATDPSSTPSPYGILYKGKLEDLPDAAKAVLNFEPAESADQTNSSSILDRLDSSCGFGDYDGSGEFPGTIEEMPPGEHGWVKVIWKPGKCTGLGQYRFPNPTLVFEISADLRYLRHPEGEDSAAYFLTN